MRWVRRGVFVLLGAMFGFNTATMVSGSGARGAAAGLVTVSAAILILRLARWMETKNERWWAALEQGRVEMPERRWPTVLGTSLGVSVGSWMLGASSDGVQLAFMAFALGTCATGLYLFWNRSSLDPPEVREAKGQGS